ncbi:RNA ligase family protein [Sulfitobacter sp. R18_1]|uniref:RNA ligase family protein n=1 Tax=Sulfitobacter sp. R18_1 TaxID=2821104 RepID=UPI001ADB2D89|nr:RNA ligase family protein [Sulfitobacter sp. R18_1]MBO9427994.1 WGR domain-containing protein [Sulfitobacter sp. R18_1]
MSEELSIDLFLTEGSSDKQYSMQLKRDGDGYRVFTQHGRRGKALREGEKTKGPVPYEEALKAYNKALKEKRDRKGYTTEISGEVFSSAENAGRKTAFRPQLLNTVEANEARGFGDDWLIGEKYDGERRGVVIGPEGIQFANRNGLEVGVNKKIADDIAKFALDIGDGEEVILDGEDMGDHIVIFDVIKYPQMDESATFAERSDILEGLRDYAAGQNMKALRVEVPLPASEFFEKRHNEIFKSGGEGFVARHADSVYEPGRPSSGGQARKYKFIASCTARVKGGNGTKRSVSLEMMNADGAWTDVGNVTIPSNADIPKPGDLIEVEYMNANRGGSLYQPVYKCVRTDVGEEACGMDTLAYKGEERDLPEAATMTM